MKTILNIYRKKGFTAILKIMFLKTLQHARKKYILANPPSNIIIRKERKLFTEELFNPEFVREKYPDEVKNILAVSDSIIKKKFRFLGVDFLFDENINWHFDPADGMEWQKKIYDERNIKYPGSPMDPKIVWELNRHQYLFTIAKAWFVSREEKYADTLFEHIESWIDDNTFGNGINWTSPLEISIRLISWVFALDLVEGSDKFKQHREKIYSSIYMQAKYLANTLSVDRIIRTNHLLGELAGLFVVSTVFEFKESKKWKDKALNLFSKELNQQVYPEGVSKEQSSSYHRFVIDFILLMVTYSKRFKLEYPSGMENVLEKMINYLVYFTMPDCKVPAIGDSDDGRGYKFSETVDFWDMRGSLSSGAALFESNEMKYVSNKFHEESFWLLGSAGYQKFSSLAGTEPKTLDKFYNTSGHYVLRNSFLPDSDYLFVRAGTFGMGGEGFCSHSHDDLLSPVICMSGRQILADSGTFAYNNIAVRNNYKISAAHNNITWKESLSKPKPNFGWEKVYNVILLESRPGSKEYSLEFMIDGLREYRRIIRYDIEKRIFIIEDRFDKDFEELEWNFHIPGGFSLNSAEYSVEMKEGESLFAKIEHNLSGKVFIKEEELSLYYGEKIKCSRLIFKSPVKKGESIIFKFLR